MRTDPRTEIRVFLGSSEQLREERAGFADALATIGNRPDLGRNFVLKPVRWETDAFGFSDDINETIQSSVSFEELHVVVILVRDHVGSGTLQEYENALRLERFRRRPRLMVFVRDPSSSIAPAQAAELRAFKERVIADGGVPNTYAEVSELWQRLGEQLPELLPRTDSDEPSTPRRLRALFLASAGGNLRTLRRGVVDRQPDVLSRLEHDLLQRPHHSRGSTADLPRLQSQPLDVSSAAQQPEDRSGDHRGSTTMPSTRSSATGSRASRSHGASNSNSLHCRGLSFSRRWFSDSLSWCPASRSTKRSIRKSSCGSTPWAGRRFRAPRPTYRARVASPPPSQTVSAARTSTVLHATR